MNGAMVIESGRHPLVPLGTNEPMVPNDVQMQQTSNLRILTGANGSGKSTYLRMIGVICILAHIGCYVPAEYACIRITDQILTRMGSSDDSDASDYSTFFSECKELAYLLEKSAAQRSIVLIDELGRATSSADGVGICWATAEALLSRPACYTVLATHFLELCELPALYNSAVNLHCSVVPHGSGRLLQYLYTIASGPIDAEVVALQYGIEMARMAAFSSDIIDEAKAIGQQLYEQISMQRVSSRASSNNSDHGPDSSHPRTRVATTLLDASALRPTPMEQLRAVFIESCRTLADRARAGRTNVWPSILAAVEKLHRHGVAVAEAAAVDAADDDGFAPAATAASSSFSDPQAMADEPQSFAVARGNGDMKFDESGVMYPPSAAAVDARLGMEDEAPAVEDGANGNGDGDGAAVGVIFD